MFSTECRSTVHRRIVTSALTLLGAGLLAILSFLRETPIFWTNLGGYPIWLRDLVRIGFYPLLFLLLTALLRLTFTLFARWKGTGRQWTLQASLLTLAWLVFLSAAGYAVINNVVNLFHNRALHRHHGDTYTPDHFTAPRQRQ